MIFSVKESDIRGCVQLFPKNLLDARGHFVKTYQASAFKELGLPMVNWQEEYFTVSHAKVVRGMHFQVPPFAHEKLVTIVSGSVVDVVLDLRKSSPTFGQFATFHLKASEPSILFIPKGLAHGFCSLQDNSTLFYKVSTEYRPDSDTGVRYDSFGFDWPVVDPVVSERDLSFTEFDQFNSPFNL